MSVSPHTTSRHSAHDPGAAEATADPRGNAAGRARPNRALLIDCAGSGCSAEAGAALAAVILARRPDLGVVLRHTPTDGPAPPPAGGAGGPGTPRARVQIAPAFDGIRAARRFLREGAIVAILLVGGQIDQALVAAAEAMSIPVVLAGAAAPQIALPAPPDAARATAEFSAPLPVQPATREGWLARLWRRLLPGAAGALLAPMRHILVPDTEAERAFVRAGATMAQLEVTGPIEEPSRHAYANEAERRALARLFGTRPVWLALDVPSAEDDMMAQAHLAAMRSAHRLLMIVVPDDPARGEALAHRLETLHGLTTARRSAEQDPLEDVQAYVADTEGETALWLRMAQMVWLGGTSCDAPGRTHPLAATSHGAALVHGNRTGGRSAIFQRLQIARASRTAEGAETLANAIEALLAPAEAAAQALAAWNIASGGAGTTRRLLEIVDEIVPASGL